MIPNQQLYSTVFIHNHKKKTNHPISNNSHPSATSNKAIHSLKIGGGGVQYQRERHIILTNYEAVHPDGRFGKQFLIRDANNLDNKPNSL